MTTPGSVDPGLGPRAVPRPVATAGLAWLAMIGVDLALHAGLLAPLYDWDSPFLLEPGAAFARIPIGYLAFLVLAAALVWLLPRLRVQGALGGALVAGITGAVTWGALLLGLWSISTAELPLLAGWWIGQSVELAVGGLVIGSILGGARLRAVAWKVGLLVVVAAALAVLLQTIGYAPVPVLR
jgi:hypothetical protein